MIPSEWMPSSYCLQLQPSTVSNPDGVTCSFTTMEYEPLSNSSIKERCLKAWIGANQKEEICLLHPSNLGIQQVVGAQVCAVTKRCKKENENSVEGRNEAMVNIVDAQNTFSSQEKEEQEEISQSKLLIVTVLKFSHHKQR